MAQYGYVNLYNESVSNVTATPSVDLGSRRIEAGNEYVYVYNKSTSTINVSFGVVLSASSGYSVTASSLAGERPFGVCKNAQIGPVNYGWILVHGFGTAAIKDSALTPTAATGSPLYLLADGEWGAMQTGATGMTWGMFSQGYCVATINSGASGVAFFQCLG